MTMVGIDKRRLEDLERKAAAYDAINTPEIRDFLAGVEREVLHQRARWGSDHDAGKTPADWFWLVGYLAGKALNHHAEAERLQTQGLSLGGELLIDQQVAHHREKAVHHVLTTAAALVNWHAHALKVYDRMRPGIATPPEAPT